MTDEATRQPAFQISVEQEGHDIVAALLPPSGVRPSDPVKLASVNAHLYATGEGVPEAFEYFLKVLGKAMVAGVTNEQIAATAQYEKRIPSDDQRQEG